jgi:hypothetical protein
MARGVLRVRTNGRGETILDVHHWPEPGTSYVCSSLCVHREQGLSLEMPWLRPQDRAEIHRRLAGSKGTSGADKGRVLYVVERRPLGGGRRMAAAGLITLDEQSVRLFRLCFSAETLRDQHLADATLLVACARSLAEAARRTLHMLTPPRAAPGEIAAQFDFVGGTERDRFGQTWVR